MRIFIFFLMLSIFPNTAFAANPAELNGKIAYSQRHRGFWQIFIANLDGSGPMRLTRTSVDKRYPSFSPSGEKIAYVTNTGELRVMDNNGKNKQKIDLPVHASQPRWHPDGNNIVFVSYQDLYHGDSELWEIELKTKKLKKITSRPWMQYDPYYGADGKTILFTDGPELYAQEIRKLNLETGDLTQLTENGPYDYDMQAVYSFDEELVTYTSNQDGNYDIWIMDKFGQNSKNLTKDEAYDIIPQFTKDDKHIYFLSDRSGSFEIWAMSIEGKGIEQLTSDKKDKQDLAMYSEVSE